MGVVLFSGRADRTDKIEAMADQFPADVLVVKHDPRWKNAAFRDNLHPAPEGNALLAQLIAERLHATRTAGPSCP